MKFFKENIMEIMAIGAMLQFLMICMLILFKQVKAAEPTTMMILTSSTNFVVIVLSFFFGSSKGSKDKQIQLDKTKEII
jgi:hypothetical protein